MWSRLSPQRKEDLVSQQEAAHTLWTSWFWLFCTCVFGCRGDDDTSVLSSLIRLRFQLSPDFISSVSLTDLDLGSSWVRFFTHNLILPKAVTWHLQVHRWVWCQRWRTGGTCRTTFLHLPLTFKCDILTEVVKNRRRDTAAVNKSWSQHLFPFSDKTPHKNKLETKLKKERSFYFISFSSWFFAAVSQVKVQNLSTCSTDLKNEIGEKSLFPRTQKDCSFFF